MPENWKWNRPEEPGLETPSFLLDPSTYLGGIGGLISKLAQRGVGTATQPALSTVSKIANLRRAGRDIQSTYTEKPMPAVWQKVQDALKRMGGE